MSASTSDDDPGVATRGAPHWLVRAMMFEAASCGACVGDVLERVKNDGQSEQKSSTYRFT